MDRLLYYLGLSVVKCFQALPLRWVAWTGRAGGALAYWLDARHRRVAIRNLSAAFGEERSPTELRGLAKENFKRLGENYCCAVKTAAMTWAELEGCLEFAGLEKLQGGSSTPQSRVFAIGHFGNFELYARGNHAMPQYQFATTYRALKQQGFNRLLLELRQRSGCLLFERRFDADALRAAMSRQDLILGFLSDQHAGSSGAWVSFFGRVCSTTTAPAIFAQRYKLPLHTAICYRAGLGRWRIEVGDEIPTLRGEERRSAKEVMRDVNQAFETAIRRDPANWFWVHNRWKPRKTAVASVRPKVADTEAAVEG